jgi:hypothetical protein
VKDPTVCAPAKPGSISEYYGIGVPPNGDRKIRIASFGKGRTEERNIKGSRDGRPKLSNW